MNYETIEQVIESLSKNQVSQGLTWYKRVNGHCINLSNMYNVPLFKVVGILSALSPMVSFKTNIRYTELWLKGDYKAVKTFRAQKEKCFNIMTSRDKHHVMDILRGFKTVSFYSNILDYSEDSHHVTIDTHMIKFFKFKTLTPKRYDQARILIQAYANEVELLPHQVQALLWIGIRREAF